MLEVTRTIRIPDDELSFTFVRSSGPGGQHVNKVATAVQLRFDAAGSPSLPDDVRARLRRQAGRKMTDEGMVVIDARRFRTRERNRQDALERLSALIRQAAVKPRSRRKTKPTLASRRRRLSNKHKRGEKKRLRGKVSPGEE